MRAAVVVLWLLLAGFDHNLHERDVAVSGAAELACNGCHTMKNGALVGQPGHATCFGACHGPPPKGKAYDPGDRKVVCEACHAKATVAVQQSPYPMQDFALAMPHKRHAEVACGQCHPMTNAKVVPHRRCAGCHDGVKAPTMTGCAACHTPGSGAPLPPRMVAPIDTVVAEFSHGKHAARGGLGAQCTTCHAEVAQTDDSALPRPKQAACGVAGCHDGKGAFAVVVACTKCHTAPPPWKFEVERPQERYQHASPSHAGLTQCASCHPLGATGEVLVAGHTACAGCHAERFGERRRPSEPVDPTRPPQICGACHNATEPWRKLIADRPPPDRTEFGATLSHAKHGGACVACHSLATASQQLRPPRGHRACTGSACHAVTGGPAPELTACESCHQLGLFAKRVALRTTVPWSVRAAFDHAPHRRGKEGEVACTTCHTDLGAESVISLAAPAKATCAPCHDGGTAFKLTGTTCTRCHSTAKR